MGSRSRSFWAWLAFCLCTPTLTEPRGGTGRNLRGCCHPRLRTSIRSRQRLNRTSVTCNRIVNSAILKFDGQKLKVQCERNALPNTGSKKIVSSCHLMCLGDFFYCLIQSSNKFDLR